MKEDNRQAFVILALILLAGVILISVWAFWPFDPSQAMIEPRPPQ